MRQADIIAKACAKLLHFVFCYKNW